MKRLLVPAACVVAALAAASADARLLHYQVTVVVTGNGHVTAPAPDSTSGSIDCPDQCSALIKQNSTITLTATPDTGSRFAGWGGDCTSAGTASTCTLTLTGQGANGSKSISAGFDVPPPPVPMITLTVQKTGTGTGFVGGSGIDCGKTCATSLAKGAKVTLVAVADPGSALLGWSGACSGAATCTLTVKRSSTATVTLADRRRPYAVALPGRGRHNAAVNLQFRVWDSKGASREDLTVAGGRVRLERAQVPMRVVSFRRILSVPWRVPRSAPRVERLCVTAFDRSGRRSPTSCAPLTVA